MMKSAKNKRKSKHYKRITVKTQKCKQLHKMLKLNIKNAGKIS